MTNIDNSHEYVNSRSLPTPNPGNGSSCLTHPVASAEVLPVSSPTPALWANTLPTPAPQPNLPQGLSDDHLDYAMRSLIRSPALWPALQVGVSGATSDVPLTLCEDEHATHGLLWDAAVECHNRYSRIDDRDLLRIEAARLHEAYPEYHQNVDPINFDRLLDFCFEGDADAGAGREHLADLLEYYLADRVEHRVWNDWEGYGTRPAEMLMQVQSLRQEIADFRSGNGRQGPCSTAEFRQRVRERDELVEGVLVANQLAVVGAATKSLKTMICLDMAISLATSTPFLGNSVWQCRSPRRVGFYSAESGAETLLYKHDRIADSKKATLLHNEREGFDRLLAANLVWDDQVPDLGDPSSVAQLDRTIRELELQVLFLDPLSVAIGSAAKELANLAIGGQVILRAAQACRQAGCTLILIHHTSGDRLRNAGNQAREPIDLTDISYPSITNHARQWITLNRAAPYDEQDRRNELWLRAGGSGLQEGGTFRVTVTEGHDHDRWDVSVEGQSQHIQREQEEQEQHRTQEHRRDCQRILEHLRRNPGASNNSMVRDTSDLHGLGQARLRELLADLQSHGAVRFEEQRNGVRWFAVADAGQSSAGMAGDEGTPPEEEHDDSSDQHDN